MRKQAGLRLIVLVSVALCLQAQSPDVEQTLLRIQDALQAGNLDSASQQIDSAFQAHPREGGLFNLRGVLRAQRNEFSDARKDFQEAVRLTPSLVPAWKNLGRACQIGTDQNNACALSAWRRVLHFQPSDPEAHSSLARLYQRKGDYSDSLRELAALPAAASSQVPNVLLRCLDSIALGHGEEARTLAAALAERADFSDGDWEGIEGSFDSAQFAPAVVTLVEGLLRRQAAGIASLRSLAIAYEQLQRPVDARKTLERVALLDPKNTAHLLELARLADGSKDYEGALGYLAHARDLAPDNPQIHFLFAMVATEMKLPIEARGSLARALELDPENPVYNYSMGFVILNTRDAATAATYFQKFVKARPTEAKGHYALGVAQFASGDYARAKEEMQLVKDNPKTAGGAEYFLGCIARRENDLEGSARHLHRSIELLPDFAESHTELARVYMRHGKLPEARLELENAIRLDRDSFQANEQLLVLYKRTHNPAADKQTELVKKLDEDRSKRAELMLRTIEVRP